MIHSDDPQSPGEVLKTPEVKGTGSCRLLQCWGHALEVDQGLPCLAQLLFPRLVRLSHRLSSAPSAHPLALEGSSWSQLSSPSSRRPSLPGSGSLLHPTIPLLAGSQHQSLQDCFLERADHVEYRNKGRSVAQRGRRGLWISQQHGENLGAVSRTSHRAEGVSRLRPAS